VVSRIRASFVHRGPSRDYFLRAIDDQVDLGAGTGYGAAILRALVGDTGQVVAVEIDPALVRRAREELSPLGVRCVVGDALDPSTWPPGATRLRKVTVGFALDSIPATWREALEPGTVIVAPLHDADGVLRLCRTVLHEGGGLEQQWGHAVSYVPARTAPPPPQRPEREAPARAAIVHLPVLD
jgi:protein-L-isoaspartate O-methyltransferase